VRGLLDVRLFEHPGLSGAYVYVEGIIAEELKLLGPDDRLTVFGPLVPLTATLNKTINASPHVLWRRSPKHRGLGHLSLPAVSARARSNVYYRMYNEVRPVPLAPMGRRATLIYDLINLRNVIATDGPEVVDYWLSQARRFDAIFTLTTAVQVELQELLGRAAPEVVVAPAAVSDSLRNACPQSPTLPFERFVLVVNPGRAHKNWQDALAAVALLMTRKGFRDLGLVLVGDLGGERDGIVRALQGSDALLRSTVLLGRVSNGILRGLYESCAVTLLMSRDEGFGIPLLESLHFGAPVVATSHPVFIEVGDDCFIRVPLDDPGSVADAIADLLGSPSMSESLVSRGRMRAQAFSYRESAAITLATLRGLAAR
jgi:glycosyltransferase involved in cell wall biosynthesis